MKLEYEITRQDYSDFNIFHFVRTRLIRTLITGFAALILLQFFLNKDETHINLVAVVVSSITFTALYGFLIYRRLTRTQRIPKDDGCLLGKKQIEFTDDEIICKDKASLSQIKWSGIKSLQENKKAFYLYLDTNMGIIIPKRFFKDEAEQLSYKQFIQKKLNVA